MLTFADGYEAKIDSVHITTTYGELIIGRPQPILKTDMEEKIKRSIERMWGDERPWHIMPRFNDKGINLRHLIYLWLDSELIPDVDDCVCGSHVMIAINLDYCYDKSLYEQLQPLLKDLNWKDIAANWDF